MDATNMFALSFYKELKPISNKNNVFLVSHVETGLLYVKKIYENYNLQIFKKIKELNIPGIPKYELLVENQYDRTLTVIEEYINGYNLDTYMQLRENPLPPLKAAEIVARLALTLGKLHNQDPPIIHRDIKPSNVLIDSDENVYLIDFNISRNLDLTKNKDTTILGTHGYASPEQYGFMQCTEKSDIYSLGVLLHFLTTKSPNDPQDAKGPLASIIKKATSMDPNNRYDSVKSMSYAILDATNNMLNPTEKVCSTNNSSNNTFNKNMSNGKKSSISIVLEEYKKKIKEPFPMDKKHKSIFLIASIACCCLFYSSASSTSNSPFELVAYLASFISICIFPFLAIYYIRSKQIYLSKNKLINILLHAVIISSITSALTFIIMFTLVIFETIFL